jgi:lysozyme family protein
MNLFLILKIKMLAYFIQCLAQRKKRQKGKEGKKTANKYIETQTKIEWLLCANIHYCYKIIEKTGEHK